MGGGWRRLRERVAERSFEVCDQGRQFACLRMSGDRGGGIETCGLGFERRGIVDLVFVLAVVVSLVLVPGHQTGRGSSLGRGLRLHRKVEIGRLVGVDLRDFRFRLVRCLAGGCDGGAQRIKKARIAGQGFEFLHSGASLLDHGVFEIEMDLFRCLGDFGIVRGVNGFLMNRAIMNRAIDGKGKRIFPLGGEVRRGFGGQFAGVCGGMRRRFLDGEFRRRAGVVVWRCRSGLRSIPGRRSAGGCGDRE